MSKYKVVKKGNISYLLDQLGNPIRGAKGDIENSKKQKILFVVQNTYITDKELDDLNLKNILKYYKNKEKDLGKHSIKSSILFKQNPEKIMDALFTNYITNTEFHKNMNVMSILLRRYINGDRNG